MEKNIRTFKVYLRSQSWKDGYQTKYKEIPAIVLSGEWLAKSDFNINDCINVEVSDGQLVIKKDYSS